MGVLKEHLRHIMHYQFKKKERTLQPKRLEIFIQLMGKNVKTRKRCL